MFEAGADHEIATVGIAVLVGAIESTVTAERRASFHVVLRLHRIRALTGSPSLLHCTQVSIGDSAVSSRPGAWG